MFHVEHIIQIFKNLKGYIKKITQIVESILG